MHSGHFITSYAESLQLLRTPIARCRMAAVAVLALLVPFLASEFQLGLANLVLINVIAAVGLNLVTGSAGQISIGHGAFVGVGAYASVWAMSRLGLPFPCAVLFGAVVAALAGGFFGIPSLRLRGFYLAIATLAAQVILEFAFRRWTPVTGGTNGIAAGAPMLLGMNLRADSRYYWVLLAVAALSVLFVRNLLRAPTGRAFMAVRDHYVAAELMGIPLGSTKIIAFAAGAFFAGLSGALMAHYVGFVTPEQFTLLSSVTFLVMIIVGGLGSVLGSVLGALFITLLPEALNALAASVFTEGDVLARKLAFIREGVFGALIILALIVEPAGLASIWTRIKVYWRLYPFSH